jgi:hypothetical protein
MPNILKRPMFRRGGPASYGVGITSGLERKKYEQGTNPYEGTSLDMDMSEDVTLRAPTNKDMSQIPVMEAYADVIQKRMMPSDKESVFDYLTSIGAAGAGSPTSLKTFGSVFGEAAKNYQAINAPKEQAAKKAGADVFGALLKGSLTKEKLYLYQQQARDLANVEQIPYNEALKRVLAKELGAKDKSEDIIEKIAQGKVSAGLDYPSARAEAEIEYKITRDPSYAGQIKGRFKGSISPSRFTQDASGNYILINPQQKGNIRVNDVFVDPNTKKLYYFDGKKLVPVK